MMQPRRVQLVLTKSQRKAVLQWVIAKVEDGTDNRIAAQAVHRFPILFNQISMQANREKDLQ